MSNITLYASRASRSFTAYWLLEELDVPYRVVETDLRRREHKSAQYLQVNPTGRVPAIDVDGTVVTERAAICTFLADRFGYGLLAPKIEAPQRGTYLKWMVYAMSALEPAIALHMDKIVPQRHVSWNSLDEVVAEVGDWLQHRQFVLGDWFTSADVMLGSVCSMAVFNRQLPRNDSIEAYVARLNARPACARAGELTWPAAMLAEIAARQTPS